MPGRDSLRRQDRHRAAATGRQLGSPALPRSRAGRRPPPGPDRPCSPPSLALCRASLSWHVPGPHIRNWTRAYGLSRSKKTFTNEAAGAPQAEQHAEDTRDSSPPPHGKQSRLPRGVGLHSQEVLPGNCQLLPWSHHTAGRQRPTQGTSPTASRVP